MDHFAVAAIVVSVIAASLLLSRLTSLHSIFKTTYLKFAIAMMTLVVLNLMIDLMFFYQLVNIGNVDIFVRNLYVVFAYPIIHLSTFCRIVVFTKLANISDNKFIIIYGVFVTLIILLDLLATQTNLIVIFTSDLITIFYEIQVIIVQILVMVGIIFQMRRSNSSQRKLVQNVILYYAFVEIVFLSISVGYRLNRFPLPVLVFIVFTLSSIFSLIELRFAKSVVLSINDRKSTDNDLASFNPDLLSEFSVTPREIEIIRLVIKGKRNQEIADDLGISINTVKDHTRKIYQKTGVNNRVELTNLFKI